MTSLKTLSSFKKNRKSLYFARSTMASSFSIISSPLPVQSSLLPSLSFSSSSSKLTPFCKPNHTRYFLRYSPTTTTTTTSVLPLRLSPPPQHSSHAFGFTHLNKFRLFERETFLHSVVCFNSAGDQPQGKKNGPDWRILKRFDVPWKWQTVILTMFACGLSFVLTGLVETAAVAYIGLPIGELSLDEKAELLLVGQGLATLAVLGVVYSLTNSFRPLPDDVFRYDLKEPFNLQKGWLLWAGVGLIGAIGGITLLGASMALFTDESPKRETDALVQLLPLIGSSGVSTACLVGITGVLAPLLEETVFRGFFMASLTMWFPTPVSVLISAAAFALAHLTLGEFPQLFILGIALGFSYSQTRNLLTPITIHALWNSGVILLLTFLQLQGYDIRELLQS